MFLIRQLKVMYDARPLPWPLCHYTHIHMHPYILISISHLLATKSTIDNWATKYILNL
jgi:hypothetical protein